MKSELGDITLVVDMKDDEIAVWAVYSKLEIDAKESRFVGAWVTDRSGLKRLHVWPPESAVVASSRAAEFLGIESYDCVLKLRELDNAIGVYQKFFDDRMLELSKSKQREQPSWPSTRRLQKYPEPLGKASAIEGALGLARWVADFADALATFTQQTSSRELFKDLNLQRF